MSIEGESTIPSIAGQKPPEAIGLGNTRPENPIFEKSGRAGGDEDHPRNGNGKPRNDQSEKDHIEESLHEGGDDETSVWDTRQQQELEKLKAQLPPGSDKEPETNLQTGPTDDSRVLYDGPEKSEVANQHIEDPHLVADIKPTSQQVEGETQFVEPSSTPEPAPAVAPEPVLAEAPAAESDSVWSDATTPPVEPASVEPKSSLTEQVIAASAQEPEAPPEPSPEQPAQTEQERRIQELKDRLEAVKEGRPIKSGDTDNAQTLREQLDILEKGALAQFTQANAVPETEVTLGQGKATLGETQVEGQDAQVQRPVFTPNEEQVAKLRELGHPDERISNMDSRRVKGLLERQERYVEPPGPDNTTPLNTEPVPAAAPALEISPAVPEATTPPTEKVLSSKLEQQKELKEKLASISLEDWEKLSDEERRTVLSDKDLPKVYLVGKRWSKLSQEQKDEERNEVFLDLKHTQVSAKALGLSVEDYLKLSHDEQNELESRKLGLSKDDYKNLDKVERIKRLSANIEGEESTPLASEKVEPPKPNIEVSSQILELAEQLEKGAVPTLLTVEARRTLIQLGVTPAELKGFEDSGNWKDALKPLVNAHLEGRLTPKADEQTAGAETDREEKFRPPVPPPGEDRSQENGTVQPDGTPEPLATGENQQLRNQVEEQLRTLLAKQRHGELSSEEKAELEQLKYRHIGFGGEEFWVPKPLPKEYYNEFLKEAKNDRFVFGKEIKGVKFKTEAEQFDYFKKFAHLYTYTFEGKKDIDKDFTQQWAIYLSKLGALESIEDRFDAVRALEGMKQGLLRHDKSSFGDEVNGMTKLQQKIIESVVGKRNKAFLGLMGEVITSRERAMSSKEFEYLDIKDWFAHGDKLGKKGYEKLQEVLKRNLTGERFNDIVKRAKEREAGAKPPDDKGLKYLESEEQEVMLNFMEQMAKGGRATKLDLNLLKEISKNAYDRSGLAEKGWKYSDLEKLVGANGVWKSRARRAALIGLLILAIPIVTSVVSLASQK